MREALRENKLNDRRFKERRESYDIKALWESHHQILRLVSLGLGNKEIAEELSITPQTVSNVRNSALAQQVLQEHSEVLDEEVVSIAKRVEQFAPTALQLLEDIISGKIEAPVGIAARTAENYMARAGHGPVQKQLSLSSHLTREDIERLKARVREAEKAPETLEAPSLEAEFSRESL